MTIHFNTYCLDPSGPPFVIHTEATADSISLHWAAPTPDSQNGIIVSYIIRFSSNGETSNISVASDTMQYVLEASPFTTYQLSVAAVNSAGVGPFSDVLELRTMEAGMATYVYYVLLLLVLIVKINLKIISGSSHEPLNLNGNASSSSTIQLQWDPPPAQYHNGEIDSYTVLCKTNTNGEDIVLTYSSLTTNITISGLHPYYTYNCSVSAVTVDQGPFSDIIHITTMEEGKLETPSIHIFGV